MIGQDVLKRLTSFHSEIRKRFPQIEDDGCGNRRIHLNCAAGTLVVDSAAAALAESAQNSNPQPGDDTPAEIATRDRHNMVRRLIADFLNADDPAEISFHLSTTNALFNLAFGLRSVFKNKPNLIVTDLDHMANISPWETFWGEERGAEIRRARVDKDGFLDLDHLMSLVDGNTVLVAVTMASNGFGSVVPLKELVASVKSKSSDIFVCVDAVHHALHGPVDVKDIGCDFLAISGYKVFGPMIGVLWGRKEMLERINSYRVETNKNESPWKFEQGTLNTPVIASLGAALEYILWIGDHVLSGTVEGRPNRFKAAMTAVNIYESELTRIVLAGFRSWDSRKIRLYGPLDPDDRSRRDPTFLFEIEGKTAAEAKRFLWNDAGIQIADGNHYSAAVYRHLKKPSLCRASLAHYNSPGEAEFFLESLGRMIR